MDYKETLDYLFNQLPVYQRIGKAAYKADLNTSLALDQHFEHPHKHYKCIHVAGTNGKGSVSHMLASVLQKAGYKCGLYTSPHLKDFRERIKINGQMISEEEVVKFVKENIILFEKLSPSFFEMTVALAFHYFATQKVDIAVVETGLGGRLDSTNIISPIMSVITNIGLDHTDILGDTVEKIAFEKAGIIKPGIPVIIGHIDEKLRNIFNDIASERKSSITFATDIVQLKRETKQKIACQEFYTNLADLQVIQTDLPGYYQIENVATTLTSINLLKEKGLNLSTQNIKDGIKDVAKNTGLSGRWQILSRKPLTICDIAHNEPGIKYIVDQLVNINTGKIHMVIGFVNDKNHEKLLQILPEDAQYYFCKADIPRGLDAEILLKKAIDSGLSGNGYPSVKAAFDTAKKNAADDDVIFVGGSAFVVAEVI